MCTYSKVYKVHASCKQIISLMSGDLSYNDGVKSDGQCKLNASVYLIVGWYPIRNTKNWTEKLMLSDIRNYVSRFNSDAADSMNSVVFFFRIMQHVARKDMNDLVFV